jgi:hypothetical protein
MILCRFYTVHENNTPKLDIFLSVFYLLQEQKLNYKNYFEQENKYGKFCIS